MEKTTKKKVERLHKFRIDGADIIGLLGRTGELEPHKCKKWRVYFEVPSGGDWSGKKVDIENGDYIYVETVTEEIES